MYAIVDIETTGGYAANNDITEVAIVLHDGEKVVKRFETRSPARDHEPDAAATVIDAHQLGGWRECLRSANSGAHSNGPSRRRGRLAGDLAMFLFSSSSASVERVPRRHQKRSAQAPYLSSCFVQAWRRVWQACPRSAVCVVSSIAGARGRAALTSTATNTNAH